MMRMFGLVVLFVLFSGVAGLAQQGPTELTADECARLANSCAGVWATTCRSRGGLCVFSSRSSERTKPPEGALGCS